VYDLFKVAKNQSAPLSQLQVCVLSSHAIVFFFLFQQRPTSASSLLSPLLPAPFLLFSSGDHQNVGCSHQARSAQVCVRGVGWVCCLPAMCCRRHTERASAALCALFDLRLQRQACDNAARENDLVDGINLINAFARFSVSGVLREAFLVLFRTQIPLCFSEHNSPPARPCITPK
jgi:hypothetical protein